MLSSRVPRHRLRIAQVAPLYVRVPPVRYGGTERVIFELTTELVRRGHDVTLFAASTSFAAARLFPAAPRPLWEIEAHERTPYEVAEVEAVVRNADSFDIVHWHIDYMHWLVSPDMATPSVTTLHGVIDGPGARTILTSHPAEPLVSISDAQRRPMAGVPLNWVATVHHGLDLESTYRLGSGDGGYLAFIGRSSAEKGLATAIRVAIRAGIPIKIGAKIGPTGAAYHAAEVVPLLNHPLVEWLGEITDEEKAAVLEHAMALLVPIDWDEPFGLCFIESLAAGTPIITKPKGSLPELMRPGVHGFFANTEDDLVDACRQIDSIDRAACRRWALQRFSATRMAQDYEAVYRRLIEREAGRGSAVGAAGGAAQAG